MLTILLVTFFSTLPVLSIPPAVVVPSIGQRFSENFNEPVCDCGSCTYKDCFWGERPTDRTSLINTREESAGKIRQSGNQIVRGTAIGAGGCLSQITGNSMLASLLCVAGATECWVGSYRFLTAAKNYVLSSALLESERTNKQPRNTNKRSKKGKKKAE